MKRVNIKCPYCGSRALLRPASVVYGERAVDPSAPYYVCARYPACDSYVAAHKDNRLPMGTLANADLRRKRIQAHTAFDRLWKEGRMSKRQAYLWLQAKLDLPEQAPTSAGSPHFAVSRSSSFAATFSRQPVRRHSRRIRKKMRL